MTPNSSETSSSGSSKDLNRLQFLKQSSRIACAACFGSIAANAASAAEESPAKSPLDEALAAAKKDDAFTKNWLSDMFDAMDADLDPQTRMKLFEACGKQCFKRHSFKTQLAEAGKGDLNKLLVEYRKSFGSVEREGDVVHIRFSGGCYCPAAKNRPARPNDPQCDCQKGTHMAIFEAALGRKVRADVAESLRRGGKCCHIRVYLS